MTASPPMTPDEIRELEGKLEKATPGEWCAEYYSADGYEIRVADSPINQGFRESFSREDAELIAALKTAAPSLLSTARRVAGLEEALRKLLEAHEREAKAVTHAERLMADAESYSDEEVVAANHAAVSAMAEACSAAMNARAALSSTGASDAAALQSEQEQK